MVREEPEIDVQLSSRRNDGVLFRDQGSSEIHQEES